MGQRLLGLVKELAAKPLLENFSLKVAESEVIVLFDDCIAEDDERGGGRDQTTISGGGSRLADYLLDQILRAGRPLRGGTFSRHHPCDSETTRTVQWQLVGYQNDLDATRRDEEDRAVPQQHDHPLRHSRGVADDAARAAIFVAGKFGRCDTFGLEGPIVAHVGESYRLLSACPASLTIGELLQWAFDMRVDSLSLAPRGGGDGASGATLPWAEKRRRLYRDALMQQANATVTSAMVNAAASSSTDHDVDDRVAGGDFDVSFLRHAYQAMDAARLVDDLSVDYAAMASAFGAVVSSSSRGVGDTAGAPRMAASSVVGAAEGVRQFINRYRSTRSEDRTPSAQLRQQEAAATAISMFPGRGGDDAKLQRCLAADDLFLAQREALLQCPVGAMRLHAEAGGSPSLMKKVALAVALVSRPDVLVIHRAFMNCGALRGGSSSSASSHEEEGSGASELRPRAMTLLDDAVLEEEAELFATVRSAARCSLNGMAVLCAVSDLRSAYQLGDRVVHLAAHRWGNAGGGGRRRRGGTRSPGEWSPREDDTTVVVAPHEQCSRWRGGQQGSRDAALSSCREGVAVVTTLHTSTFAMGEFMTGFQRALSASVSERTTGSVKDAAALLSSSSLSLPVGARAVESVVAWRRRTVVSPQRDDEDDRRRWTQHTAQGRSGASALAENDGGDILQVDQLLRCVSTLAASNAVATVSPLTGEAEGGHAEQPSSINRRRQTSPPPISSPLSSVATNTRSTGGVLDFNIALAFDAPRMYADIAESRRQRMALSVLRAVHQRLMYRAEDDDDDDDDEDDDQRRRGLLLIPPARGVRGSRGPRSPWRRRGQLFDDRGNALDDQGGVGVWAAGDIRSALPPEDAILFQAFFTPKCSYDRRGSASAHQLHGAAAAGAPPMQLPRAAPTAAAASNPLLNLPSRARRVDEPPLPPSSASPGGGDVIMQTLYGPHVNDDATAAGTSNSLNTGLLQHFRQSTAGAPSPVLAAPHRGTSTVTAAMSVGSTAAIIGSPGRDVSSATMWASHEVGMARGQRQATPPPSSSSKRSPTAAALLPPSRRVSPPAEAGVGKTPLAAAEPVLESPPSPPAAPTRHSRRRHHHGDADTADPPRPRLTADVLLNLTSTSA